MTADTLLTDGISQLCQNDPSVDSLIAPRKEKILSLLKKYLAEIESHNPALGLVGTNDHHELIIRHILDSLAPVAALLKLLPSTGGHVADVGSGAGLPGIPLAIALPDTEFTLIERMGRRAGFLRNVLAVLGLPNVSLEEAEMEKVQTGRFDIVTFRAFKPLEPKMYKKLARLCTSGGCLAAYKGRHEKIAAEMAGLAVGKWEAIPCLVPFLEEERHLVVIYPAAHTPV